MHVVRAPDSGFEGLPNLLTIEEAADVLRVSRSQGYVLARRYLDTKGGDGLPVLRLGARMRVPRWALIELARTGRVVQLADGVPSRDRHHGPAG